MCIVEIVHVLICTHGQLYKCPRISQNCAKVYKFVPAMGSEPNFPRIVHCSDTVCSLLVHCLFTCTCLQAQTSRSEQVVNKQCNCSAQSLGNLVHFPSREQTCTPLHNFEKFWEILGHIELTSCACVCSICTINI